MEKRQLSLFMIFSAVMGLVVILCIGCAAVVFSTSGAENEMAAAYRTAAQCHKRMSAQNMAQDYETNDNSSSAIVGYYKDIPITKDQVVYKQAMDKLNQNPEKSEKEAVLAVAKDLYTLEQAKLLGFYPSDERIDEIIASETESFQANLEENMEFCSMTGLTQEESIAWSVQLNIEGTAKAELMSHTAISLMEEQTIADELLARLVQSLSSEGSNKDLPTLLGDIYDRYATLQVQDEVTFVTENGDMDYSPGSADVSGNPEENLDKKSVVTKA